MHKVNKCEFVREERFLSYENPVGERGQPRIGSFHPVFFFVVLSVRRGYNGNARQGSQGESPRTEEENCHVNVQETAEYLTA